MVFRSMAPSSGNFSIMQMNTTAAKKKLKKELTN